MSEKLLLNDYIFGDADAETEFRNKKEIFEKAFYDPKNIVDKLINGYQFMLIGRKGVAISKPNAEIFHHALDKINYHDKKKVLMVGDSLTSDIQGGINAGIDTCWYNPNEYINNTNIKPTYEIKSLFQLRELLK